MTDQNDEEDFQTIANFQLHELMAAKNLESDLDFAFNLQLQEAIKASLSLHPALSSSTPPPPHSTPPDSQNSDFSLFSDYQPEQLDILTEFLTDHKISTLQLTNLKNDLHHRIQGLSLVPEPEWAHSGDHFQRPFGEGSSTSNTVNNETFRVYFKGLVSEEKLVKSTVVLAGIGVGITDSKGELIFKVRKPLIGNGMSRQAAELKALIEGLNAAITLDLKRVVFYCDYRPIYMFVTGRWYPKRRKIATLADQVSVIRKKFTSCNPYLVARNEVKFAFKLAREAIVSQINKPAESSGDKTMYESCVICLEDTDVSKMFSIDDCMHRYCFSCMKQHVEMKLLHGMVPKCPHEKCNSELKIDSCSKFLTPKLIEMMNLRMKEASIPVTEKLYCPYPKCSALMSKSEVLEYSKGSEVVGIGSGVRKCIKCHGCFCINCKVPWHNNMTCSDYKRKNPNPQGEDAKLKTLAANNLWRQCVTCNHMIELAAGCYHMTCRCGHQFCYTCGAEWKNKKATCSCPLWDEDNILDDSDEDDDEDDDFDDEEENEFYDSASDDYWW